MEMLNLKRLFISDAGFLLIKVSEFKNGHINGYEVSDNGGIESVEWQKGDKDIKSVKGIKV